MTEEYNITKPTKRCEKHLDADILFSLNPPGSTHFGKWKCSECNKFVTHAQTPKTNVEVERRKESIVGYIMNEKDMTKVKRLCDIYGKSHIGLVEAEFLRRYKD